MTIYKGNQIIAGGNLPTQTGKSGKFLKTDGSNPSWETVDVPTKTSDLTNDSGFITSSYHDSTKQDTLASGTNIKTINSTSILGSGNVAVQPTLVSGTNIKTINSQSLLGSGDITISGTGANTDLSNLSTTGKSTASGFGLPSSTSVDLTLGASGSSYTAPANGWFIVILKATATTWANIYCNGFQYNASTNVYTNNFINCIVPAKKNHILSIHYGSAAKEKFYFIYAEGEQ